jgi:xanthine dehydrogenase accessory factor
MAALVVLRGGGDLASGVALRLHRAGLRLLITELSQPLVVRRLVSFAEAVYAGQAQVEGVTARLAKDLREAASFFELGIIPVLVDPQTAVLHTLRARVQPGVTGGKLAGEPLVILVDARMTKGPPEYGKEVASLVIGLGPGFVAGENCHAVIETNRGHSLGRVLWQGPAERDTGIPEAVAERRAERVLRAPVDGQLKTCVEICSHLEPGQLIAEVAGQPVLAPFHGVLRGLLHPGLVVRAGMKIGDVDPRSDPRYCWMVSDKSLAVGGGVLEAILSRPRLRPYLWD